MFLIENIFDYLSWANTSIWKIVESLSNEEFMQTLAEGGGSIQRRYMHLAEDTWEWFHDWHSEEQESPDFHDMTMGELYQFISDYLEKWRTVIKERNIGEFTDEREGKTVVITIDEMLFHLVNHFTYHRGQIAMGLKILGKDVPMTDYIPYRFSAVQ